MFSWKPIYQEIAGKILQYRDKQGDLLTWLAQMKEAGIPVIKLEDQNPMGTVVPLAEMDPFTFFANFNRGITTASRIEIIRSLKYRLSLSSPIPKDFDALPIANLQKAWFFPYAHLRDDDTIDKLWDLADQVVNRSARDLDADVFHDCLAIPQVGLAKLTMGMFWMRPDEYLALDQVNVSYLGERGFAAKDLKRPEYAAYLATVAEIKDKLGTDLVNISHDAYTETATLSLDREKLDAGFRALLERTAKHNGVSIESVAQWLKASSVNGLENEISNRARHQRELGDLLRSGRVTLESLKSTLTELWVLGGMQDSLRRSNYLKSGTALDQITALLDEEGGIPPLIRINEFVDVAFENGYRPSTGGGKTDVAQFASVLLSAYFPAQFVDFRKGRWNRLYREIFNTKKTILKGQNYGFLLLRSGSFAAQLSQTPTFQEFFGDQPELWTAAGIAYMYKDGVFDMNEIKQYWAGGFLWGGQGGEGVSHLEEFVDGNLWKTGYSRDGTDKKHIDHWQNFDRIKVGDEFAIKGYGGRNDLVIHYVGEVTDIEPEDGVIHLKQLERKLFHGKGPSLGKGSNWFGTLVSVTNPDAIQMVFHGKEAVTPPSSKHALNAILYGPPGTGKTYRSTHRAIEIVDGEHEGLTPEERQQRFDDLLDQDRVQFITFHQSYAYEDFVEGIRPVLGKDGTDGTPKYECRDGIFKRISIEALYAALDRPASATPEAEFEARWTELTNQIEEAPDREYDGLTEKTRYTLGVSAQGNITARNVINPDASPYVSSRRNMKKVFAANPGQQEITIREINETLGVGSHAHLATVVFHELMRVPVDADAQAADRAPAASYEERKQIVLDYLEHRESSGYRLKADGQVPRYVLVIDEINRGNISKILGELVTLLESDKRVGAPRQLRVTLPYSDDVFGVPRNLYIVGTMNTADKSIALVDVALRRRFEFQELMPDFGKPCPELPQEARSVLDELNRRIALRKDRDHQIGHSYFIDVSTADEFNDTFAKTTIPLLQEYFYNDWDGLRSVLGEEQQEDGVFIRSMGHGGLTWARNRWQWHSDAGVTDLNYLDVLLKNYKLNGGEPPDDG